MRYVIYLLVIFGSNALASSEKFTKDQSVETPLQTFRRLRHRKTNMCLEPVECERIKYSRYEGSKDSGTLLQRYRALRNQGV